MSALEKLTKALAAIAQDIAQLKLDIAKLDARVAVIDNQVVGIARRLDTEPLQGSDEGRDRDLDLEREVFGAPKTPKKRLPQRMREQRPRPPSSAARKKKSAKKSVGRVRR